MQVSLCVRVHYTYMHASGQLGDDGGNLESTLIWGMHRVARRHETLGMHVSDPNTSNGPKNVV